jgi:hypothetical protein
VTAQLERDSIASLADRPPGGVAVVELQKGSHERTMCDTKGVNEMDRATKTRENALRRVCDRRGLRLQKHRVRDPKCLWYGYQIQDARTARVLASKGPVGYGMNLDEVAAWLEVDI